MSSDSVILGALNLILCVALFALGLGLGHDNATDRAIQGCTMQGSFVADGKVYDCAPRARQ